MKSSAANASKVSPVTRPYATRRIQFLKYWQHQRTKFKVYAISMGSRPCSPEMITAALRKIATHLRENPTKQTQYGVGIISIHAGRGENQIVIDRWINENEILHQILISSEKTPTKFHKAPRDHNSVCVWELYLQGFERKAWLDHVLRSGENRPVRMRRYLAEQLNARV
jgi:hypothetical protein